MRVESVEDRTFWLAPHCERIAFNNLIEGDHFVWSDSVRENPLHRLSLYHPVMVVRKLGPGYIEADEI